MIYEFIAENDFVSKSGFRWGVDQRSYIMFLKPSKANYRHIRCHFCIFDECSCSGQCFLLSFSPYAPLTLRTTQNPDTYKNAEMTLLL